MYGLSRTTVAALALIAALALGGCAAMAQRRAASPRAPYRPSHRIESISWDFSTLESDRKAHGSDLWPCAWAADDELYCAWGDGGGFDGDDDHIGRVSLGFARVSGTPRAGDPAAISGRNIWGEPPYALHAATFGGKVGSMLALGGVLYAHGGFWTQAKTADPVHKGGPGPLHTVAWSTDFAQTWQLADWSSDEPLGIFLDAGRDPGGELRAGADRDAGADRGTGADASAPAFVLEYYQRPADTEHLYLMRVAADRLTQDPSLPGNREYFAGLSFWRRAPQWSRDPHAARPVFRDANHVEGACITLDLGLGRYLLTAGHYATGNDDDSSAGQVGLFEAPHPWGPWHTIGYYENWGGAALDRETRGDFLGLRLPSKWISAGGTEIWAVFSGLHSLDSWNLVRGELHSR